MTLDVERNKLIVSRCNKLLEVCLDSEKETIETIRDNAKYKLDEYNNKKITVVNPTNREIGRWKASVRALIKNRFLKQIEDRKVYTKEEYDFICESHRIYDESKHDVWFYDYENACDSCRSRIDEIENSWKAHYDLVNKAKDEFYKAIDNTILEDKLMERFVLVGRKIKRSDNNPLEKPIRESIHTQFLKEFQEQNKELITKYL